MSSHQRRINRPTAPSIRHLFDLVDRITAVQWEMMITILRLGSANTTPSSAAARPAPKHNAVLDSPPAAKTSGPPIPVDPGTGQADVSPESIRSRAYEIYERRGHRPGDARADWYRAEAELGAVDGGATD